MRVRVLPDPFGYMCWMFSFHGGDLMKRSLWLVCSIFAMWLVVFAGAFAAAADSVVSAQRPQCVSGQCYPVAKTVKTARSTLSRVPLVNRFVFRR